jgi:hypothetical protein
VTKLAPITLAEFTRLHILAGREHETTLPTLPEDHHAATFVLAMSMACLTTKEKPSEGELSIEIPQDPSSRS